MATGQVASVYRLTLQTSLHVDRRLQRFGRSIADAMVRKEVKGHRLFLRPSDSIHRKAVRKSLYYVKRKMVNFGKVQNALTSHIDKLFLPVVKRSPQNQSPL